MNKYITFTPEQRISAFWKKVNKDGPIPAHCPELGQCWEWTGNKQKKMGYGQFIYDKRVQQAHRVVWMLTIGKIPDGLFVLHKCDNPPCVNPEHLFIGTHVDNMKDRKQKGRYDNLPKGENHCRHKFTEDQIRYIRYRFSSGDITTYQLAREMNASQTAIWNIIHFKRWKHII